MLQQEVCAAVQVALAESVKNTTRMIRAEVPEYAVVDVDEHTERTFRNQTQLLRLLADGREPGETDLRAAADLGRLRSSQGIAVESVIAAYNVGNQELWRLLCEAAGADSEVLVKLATRLLHAVEVITSEMAAAHTSYARVRQAQDVSLRHRLVELLSRETVAAEARDIVAVLGADPDGSFRAMRIAPAQIDDDSTQKLARALGTRAIVADSHETTVLSQGLTEEELQAAAERWTPGRRVGIGLGHGGLEGAHRSLSEARMSLATATDRTLVQSFERDWLWATVVAARSSLEPIVAVQRTTVEQNPHLVETLEAFMTTGFSMAKTAQLLHLHANSVAYRLDRWYELTGWDPRTFAGLCQSLLAIALLADAKDS
ncbi:helix-turn-helix domain-containing protein [Arthrobacter sp. NPDC080031]|uniref:PucR family transcriptional regulator n=1 Tax=Arthrobacter sp. NPDC080031 TaxID=3155918 RepID=UPI00344E27BA